MLPWWTASPQWVDEKRGKSASWEGWLTPVLSGLRSVRQEDSPKFKVSLGYLVRHRPNWTREGETVSAYRIQGGDPEVSDSAPSSCNPHHPRLAQNHCPCVVLFFIGSMLFYEPHGSLSLSIFCFDFFFNEGSSKTLLSMPMFLIL